MASPTSPTILEKLTDSFEAVQEAMTPTSKVNSEASDSEEAKPAEAEAEAAKPAEAEAEAPKKKKERQIPIPKDSASFFRVRAKHVKMFQFTPDGNLQVPEMRGEPAKVIEIPYYRPATANEIAIDEAKQIEEIQAVEREFDETYTLLKKAVVEWRETRYSADIIKYQRDLQRLDAQRTQLRYPVRWTKTFKNLSVNEILLTEIYEGRKLGYPVDALRTRSLAFDRVIRADGFKKPLPQAKEEEAEAEASEEEVEDFIIFSAPTDPDHGALSPDTMVEFIYNSTKYNCVFQAYEGERLTMLGRQDVRPTLLKSRNPRQMRVIASRVVGQVEKPRELLIEILKSLITQHPRFAEVLRSTGTATLVFAEAKDGILGVGMNPTDPQVTEREAWKGTNLLGQAWTAARASLPPLAEGQGAEGQGAEGQKALVQSGGFTEHGKTMAEAKEQRRKVLSGFYRRSKA